MFICSIVVMFIGTFNVVSYFSIKYFSLKFLVFIVLND